MSHNCCNDFTRSQALRRAAANAGRAMAPRDPRAPVAAGSGLDRRQFLLRSTGAVLSLYGASRLDIGALEEGIAAASSPSDRVLVSVFLPGGVDSVSVLAPVGDPAYRRLRPKLALAPSDGTAFSEDARLRWHPSAAGFAQLHSEGKASVMPAIGYDHPDQSHFNSRHFYEVGSLNPKLVTGWMGRFLDSVGRPDNPLQGLAMTNDLSPALATAKMPVAAIDSPGDYDFRAPGVWGEVESWMLETFHSLGQTHAGSRDTSMALAGSAAVQSARLRQQLAPFDGQKIQSPVAYPEGENNGFARRLKELAAMLAGGLPLKCVALNAPGDYDTHDSQPDDLTEGLKLTADGLLAFQRDLEARGLADRVVIQVWSEFGRRGEENGSEGTDHGAAGLGMLIGTHARGTLVGEYPGMERLDEDGNLRMTSDFRGVYCSLLEQWFGHDAASVIPEAARFGRPALIK
jgi:uncharacterized protein (DUF1501 family)